MNIVPWMKKHWTDLLGVAAVIAIVILLWNRLSQIDWGETYNSIATTPWEVTALALTLGLLSYGVFCFFDRIGLKKTAASPGMFDSFVAAFICYAASLNFGSLVGGVGMRFKLYSDMNVTKHEVVRITTLSTLSNWGGYFLVAGIFFATYPKEFVESGWLRGIPWRQLGIVGVSVTLLSILALNWFRNFRVFKFQLTLPPLREGLVRISLGALNWILVSLLLTTIFCWHLSVPFHLVLLSYFASAIAGVIVHVPGGLGVFEATFLTIIGPVIGDSSVMGGVLLFRIIYYFVPLGIAMVLATCLRKSHQLAGRERLV